MPVTATASLRANVPATAVSSADADLETVSVTIRGFAFPAELRIRPGTRVVWLNADADDHDVAALDESWASPVLVVGASYSRDFLEEGRFRYLCKLHPFMQGVIVVE
jgi:plastocyanin